jgi:hypothetical protein
VIRVSAWTYRQALHIERALSGVVVEGGWAEDFSSRPATDYAGLQPSGGAARPLRVVASGIGIDVTFDRFHMFGGNVVGSGGGGAIALSSFGGAGSQVILELEDMFLGRNEVAGVNALSNGGGAVNGGCHQGRIEFRARSSHFYENVSAGGTLHFDSYTGCTSELTLEDSEISENVDAGLFLNSLAGGAATLDMVHTHIFDNGFGASALQHAVYLQVDGGTIEASSLNDTIAGNASYGVVLDVWSAGSIGFDATNSILWGSGGADLSIDSGARATVEYSDLGVVETIGTEIFDAGEGNFDADPHFAGLSNRRHLGPNSPAIDTGLCTRRVCTPQPFPKPPICIRVRVAPFTDFEGDPRPTGTGCDVGADEFVPEPAGSACAGGAAEGVQATQSWPRPSRRPHRPQCSSRSGKAPTSRCRFSPRKPSGGGVPGVSSLLHVRVVKGNETTSSSRGATPFKPGAAGGAREDPSAR